MFAVVKTGGKQYNVKLDDVVKVEKIDKEVGEVVELSDILAVSKDGELIVGTPVVENAKVEAEILEHGRGDKILVFKKRRRKDSKKMIGHRQYYTKLKIKNISC
jgi:large subunit ribosomal protein L21